MISFIQEKRIVMSERKYDFNEYDRNEFSRVLYNLKFEEWSVNNFISHLQILLDREPDKTKKEEYAHRIKSIKKRKPMEIKSRDIGFVANRTKSTVDKWIAYSGSNEPKLPDIEVLPYLSRAFGVSTDCLLGLVPFPEIDKGDFPNLNKYGIDIDSFQKVYNLECNEQNDFFYVLKALDLLLAQNSSSFSLLINIGKYLTSDEKQTGVFLDNMNLFDLTMFIQNMIMNVPPENKTQFIDETLREEGITKLRYLTDITIDNIIAELKRYKVELKALEVDK